MNVDAAIRRHLKNLFRKNLSKGNDYHDIRLIFPKFFYALRRTDFFRLEYWNPILQRHLLHRRILHPAASSFWLIRLRDCQHHLMSGLYQGF